MKINYKKIVVCSMDELINNINILIEANNIKRIINIDIDRRIGYMIAILFYEN